MTTATQVHRTIQEMNNDLPVNERVHTLGAIAGNLNIGAEELRTHIEMLRALLYVRFTDTQNDKVRLTFNGEHTTVPVWS